jgi:hypothetical protein
MINPVKSYLIKNASAATHVPNILKILAKLIALFHNNTPHCHTPKLIGRPSAYPAGPTISPIDSVNSREAGTLQRLAADEFTPPPDFGWDTTLSLWKFLAHASGEEFSSLFIVY